MPEVTTNRRYAQLVNVCYKVGMTEGARRGLTSVSTEELKQLLRYLHRGELGCPVSPSEIARLGFQDRSDPLLHTLRGLDDTGVRAVVVAVLAEREQF